MSDVPHDRDWWLASDDKWYPPEQHPDYGQRISVSDVGLESAAFEDEVGVDDFPHKPLPEPEPIVIKVQPEPEIERSEPEPELVPDVAVAEESVVDMAESIAQGAAADDEPNDDDKDVSDDSGFVDRLFELSEQRVAGEIDDDEFADAQTRLIQGD